MQGIVLVMEFMHFIEEIDLVEKSMEPVEEEILGEKNNDQLD